MDYKCTNVDKFIYSKALECSECIEGFYYDIHDKVCKGALGNLQIVESIHTINKDYMHFVKIIIF